MNSKTANFKPPVNVIKNPSRNAPREEYSFEPEYQRLGIDPIPRGTDRAEPDVYVGVDSSSYDGEGNSMSVDDNHMMIDNNEFVFEDHNMPPSLTNIPLSIKKPSSSAPQIGDFILMVNGKLISSGTMEVIEKRVKGILYKEDQEFNEHNITVDDIVVLKRVEIKVGVFVGE